MFVRHLVFLLAVSTALATPAAAQDTTTTTRPAGGRWDLQTCLDYAKKNNITLNSLRLNKATAEQNYLLSKAQQQPTLNGAGSLTYTHSKNANPVIGGFQTQSSWANNFSATSSVTIWNGGFLRNDIRQKNLEIESANLNILTSVNDIKIGRAHV